MDWKLTDFKASFKNKKIIWVLAYDLCFLLVAGIILKLASMAMTWQMNRLGLAGMISGPTVTEFGPEIAQNLGAIRSLAIAFFIISIIMYILLLIDYSLFRGCIWTKLLNKTPTKKYMKKFFLLNLIWVTIWIALLIGGVSVLNQDYYVYMLAIGGIAYIHLTTVLHHAFTYTPEIKKSLKKAFSLGIGRIWNFILPYIYIIIIYIVASRLFALIPVQGQQIAIVAVGLLFMAWYRTYMNRVIIRIEKH